MTTKAEQERNLINIRRARITDLLGKGISNQNEIAKTLNISEPTVCRDIQYLNQQARENLQTFHKKRLAIEFEKAISTFDYVIRTAATTADTTNDEKTKLAAIREMREARAAKMDLISNVDVMNYQASKGKQDNSRGSSEEQKETGSATSLDNWEEEQEI